MNGGAGVAKANRGPLYALTLEDLGAVSMRKRHVLSALSTFWLIL